MRTLVAGAGGFIGGYLVKRLLAEGHEVLAVDYKPFSLWSQRSAATDLQLDLQQKDACFRVCQRMDEIYNLAAAACCDPAEYMLSSQINASLLLGAKRRRVKRYFFASGTCVYPDAGRRRPRGMAWPETDAWPSMPEDGRGTEKLFSEQMCRHFTEAGWVETRVGRFDPVYGPLGIWRGGDENMLAALCRQLAEAKRDGRSEVKLDGLGTDSRSFCYVYDCVEGILRIMRSDHRGPLNLGSAETVTVNALARAIGRIAGVKGLRLRYDKGKQVASDRHGDNSLIEGALGWKPETPLKVGLKETFKWVKEQVRITA